MTNQERLEKIKRTFLHSANDEIAWLIEQAEEKMQLEESLEYSTKMEVEMSEELLEYQYEIQRYKQALEFYADPENHDREVDYGKDSGLKGDTNA